MQEKKSAKKILLVHLVSNGDCLYVTALARQIKLDYPGCHLTWMISNLCAQVLINNEYVDEVAIWEVKNVKDALFDSWCRMRQSIGKGYDHIFSTQFFPENIHHYDGTIRSTLLRSYPGFKNMDVTPHLRLTSGEISNAAAFADRHQLNHYSKRILFECTPGSNQSFINPALAVDISQRLVNRYPDMVIILSTHLPLETGHPRIIVANQVSFRENAELAKYCNFLIGASSGITWLLTSDWLEKPLPTIQLLSVARGISFASVKYDFEYWGLPHDHVVEIFTADTDRIVNCIELYYQQGMPACIQQYNEEKKPDPFFIKDYFNMVAKRKNIRQLLGLFKNFGERNGYSPKLLLAFIFIVLQGIGKVICSPFAKKSTEPEMSRG